jgi:hypothetical protein
LVPGLAAIDAVAGHNTVAAIISMSASRPTSVRGIERIGV